MRLVKAGIVEEYVIDEELGFGPRRPTTATELMRYWHRPLDGIAEDYLFGDLIELLRGVEDVELLAHLVGCDIAAFLEEAERSATLGERDAVEFVKVCNVADPQRYCPDPAQPDEPIEWLDEVEATDQDRIDASVADLTGEAGPLKVIDATSDDPVTGQPVFRRMRGARYGHWDPPFEIRREFVGWGRHEAHEETSSVGSAEGYEGAFALDFSPIQELLSLPLRYDGTVRFTRLHAKGSRETLFETEIGISFGEFLHAIFWEIGFFGTPFARGEALEEVRARAEAVDRRRGESA